MYIPGELNSDGFFLGIKEVLQHELDSSLLYFYLLRAYKSEKSGFSLFISFLGDE